MNIIKNILVQLKIFVWIYAWIFIAFIATHLLICVAIWEWKTIPIELFYTLILRGTILTYILTNSIIWLVLRFGQKYIKIVK